ncbi:killer cell lectin-like receptor subfamily B member 1B allele B [Dendrobates tinctorius]|uniref:killer cell lectin-like receptor subfamily B member 1B allele B n=1 Tax=Dendrobates tinctorius TaxID=92724 RepID=UPI003CC99006
MQECTVARLDVLRVGLPFCGPSDGDEVQYLYCSAQGQVQVEQEIQEDPPVLSHLARAGDVGGERWSLEAGYAAQAADIVTPLVFILHKQGCLLCPPDWQLYRDHCYYYSDVTGTTWSQSRDDCKKMRADLLVIKDQEQQKILQKSIAQRGDTYWIGLHRDGDVWRWVDGEHYSGSLFQIKTPTSGRCVSMTTSDYYQDDCNTGRRWICVKKAVRI